MTTTSAAGDRSVRIRARSPEGTGYGRLERGALPTQ